MLPVAECCLGTMTWGRQNEEGEAHEQLSYAVNDSGINFIDTAEIYPVPPRCCCRDTPVCVADSRCETSVHAYTATADCGCPAVLRPRA